MMTTDRADDRSPKEPFPHQSPGPTSDGTAEEEFRRKLAEKQSETNDSDQEQEVWQGGYSPKAMVGTWLSLTAISLVAFVGTGLVDPGLVPTVLGLLMIIWLAAGLVYAWRRFGVHYELTTQRFVHQEGILTRRTDRIEVIDIDDVSFTQGPIERIFSVGTIVLTSSDRTHPVLSMIGIADVKQVAGLIDDIRRKERRRRSLHIEAI